MTCHAILCHMEHDDWRTLEAFAENPNPSDADWDRYHEACERLSIDAVQAPTYDLGRHLRRRRLARFVTGIFQECSARARRQSGVSSTKEKPTP